MRRRILLAFAGLAAAIMIGAVIPLGYAATTHDYSAYVEDAQSRARIAAAAAEEWLGDRIHRAGPGRVLTSAGHAGDGLAILTDGGAVIASAGPRFAVPLSIIRRTAASGSLVTQVAEDKLLVVVPVHSGNRTVGLVALLRPTAPLEYSVRTFWLTLALIAAAALAAAVTVGSWISRWVARPLAVLDASARRLGDGDLTTRAASASGPAELRRLASTFNTMADRLETLVHGHRAVIEDVSHQLRTPLAALRLRLDLLAPDADEGAAAEITGLQSEVARLSRLVDGLLAVARAENATPRPVLTDIGQVIGERVAAWAPVAAEQDIELTGDCHGPVHALLAAGYLEQILDNLIANAVEAAGTGSHVTVSARTAPAGAVLAVADDGPGMTEAERDRAFLRFGTGSVRGSGLGLAIVHRLVSSSGGEARLSPTPGGGLTVTLELPGPGRSAGQPSRSQRSAISQESPI